MIIQIQWTPGQFPEVQNGRIAYGYHVPGTDHCAGGTADGTKTADEGCDDNNSTNGDGCSSVCLVETGFTCTGTSPSVCSAICGDSLIKGSEGCDDGGTTNGDGCSSTCAVESGWTCSGTPSTCQTSCGDGLKKGSETCDDSNTANGDGCNSTCTVESGWTCAETPSTCNKCGNSVIGSGEGCDDGNTTNSDGCSSTCTVESGYTCTGTPSTCTNKGVGGGGGGSGGGLPEPPIKPAGPPKPCGNAILEPEKCEECDNGRANGTSECTANCRLLYCGDGDIATHLKEECEGRIEEERGEDPVTRTTVSRFWFVTTSCGTGCTLPKWIQKGNIWEYTKGTGCKRDWSLPPCTGQPTERRMQVRPPFSCATSPGSASSGPSSAVSSRPLHCGDGILQTKEGEECDRVLYDKAVVQRIGKALYGCSLDCRISYCGDGNITPYAPLNEECDPKHPSYQSLLCAQNDQTLGCTQECRITHLSRCITPPLREEIPVTNIQEPLPEKEVIEEKKEIITEEEEEDLEEAPEEEPILLSPETPTPPSSIAPSLPSVPIPSTPPTYDNGNVQEWETCDPPCPTSCQREEVHTAAEESSAGRPRTSTMLLLGLAGMSAAAHCAWRLWIAHTMNTPQK